MRGELFPGVAVKVVICELVGRGGARRLEWGRFAAQRGASPLIHGRPQYAKHSIRENTDGIRLQPYIRTLSEAVPLSLMEFADRALITTTRSKRCERGRVTRSRSYLSCHHVMIA